LQSNNVNENVFYLANHYLAMRINEENNVSL